MMRPIANFGFFAAAIACNSAAYAAEYLTEVDSDVYSTTGTQAEITNRAATCIAQVVKPGNVATQLIISKDTAAGVIVANNGITSSQAFVNWQIRTTLTFEAKDGRFRIRHTDIQRFNSDWSPIGKWTGSGWKSAEAAIQNVSVAVATCVQKPAQSSNW